jgi:tape measure domain-containing protein
MPQNVTRTIYINAKGEAVNTIRGLNAELTKLSNAYKNAKIGSEEYINAQKELDKVKKIYAEHSASLRPIQSGYTQLTAGLTKFATAAGLAFSVDTLLQYGREVLKVANTQEQFNIALNTMVGTKAKADQVIAQGIALATNSPFTITQVQEGTKQLLAMGFSADEVIDKLEILGNIGAGVGTDKLPQLTLALGQVKAAGRLMGQELNQFVQAGVPLLEEIGKAIGKPTSEIKKMVEAGQIGYPIVEKALQNLTTEGGRFAGLMEKQAKSLGGLWSTLGDSFTQNVSLPIGQSIAEIAKPAIKALTEVIDGLSDSTKSSMNAFKEQSSKVKDLERNVTPLIDRYDLLTSKSNLSKKEQTELKDIIQKVGEAIPTAKVEVDNYGNALSINTQYARGFIAEQKVLSEYLNRSQIALEQAHLKQVEYEISVQKSFVENINSGKIVGKAGLFGSDYTKDIDAKTKAVIEHTSKLNEAGKLAEGIRANLKFLQGDFKQPEVKKNDLIATILPDPEKAKKRAADIIDALKSFNDQVKDLAADLEQNQEEGYQRDILKVNEKYQKQFDALAEFRAKYPEAISKANAIEAQMQDLQGKTIQSIISNQFKDLETELEKHNAEQLAQLQSKEDKEIAAINQKYEKQIKILITLENDTANASEAQRTNAHKKRIEFETTREQEVNNLKARLRAEQSAKDAEETDKFWAEMKRLKDDFDQAMAAKPVSFKDPNAPDEVLLNIQAQADAEKAIINKKYDDLIEAEKGYDDRIADLRSKKAQLITAVEKKETFDVAKIKFDFQQKQLQAETELKLTRLSAISDGIGAVMQFTKQNSGIQKALFAFQKGVAISELIIKGAIERATISATYAANPALALPLLLQSKIRTGINIATVAATGIAEFVTPQKYMGGFHNVVGATDGQTYKAQYVGAPNTGMLNYNSPVLLNSGVLANEKGPEYFVANSDLRNPAVFNYVQAIENIKSTRTPQYQDGGFAPNTTNSTSANGNNDQINMMMIATMQELNNTLKSGIVARFEDVWATVKDIKEYTDRYKKITGEA